VVLVDLPVVQLEEMVLGEICGLSTSKKVLVARCWTRGRLRLPAHTLPCHFHCFDVSGAIFADHSNFLLLGFSSFTAAASMAFTLASCLSNQFTGSTAILLQELFHLLLPTAWGSLTVAACKAPLAPTPVIAPLSWRAPAGPSFPASMSVATISLLSSSCLPFPLLPQHSISDQRLTVRHSWTPIRPSLGISQCQGRSKIPLVTASQHPWSSMSRLKEVDGLVVDVEVVDAAA